MYGHWVLIHGNPLYFITAKAVLPSLQKSGKTTFIFYRTK